MTTLKRQEVRKARKLLNTVGYKWNNYFDLDCTRADNEEVKQAISTLKTYLLWGK